MKALLFTALLALASLNSAFGNSSCIANVFNEQTPTLKPRIIVLSAPSGGGKTTLAQMLIKQFPRLALSVSSTTRAPRGVEKDGVDYHFLTRKQFQEKIQRGEFAEWAEVHGNFYGTDINTIRSQHAEGNSVLALLDIKGAENLRQKFPNEVHTIFIRPPSLKVLEQRLRARGTEREEVIQLRLQNARQELAEAYRFNSIIVNNKLDRAFEDLSNVIEPLLP